MKYLIPGILSLYLLSSCADKNKINSGIEAFSKDSLKQSVKMLASDEFQGRKPFTIGETKTVEYIRNKFSVMGLEPGNGSSFTQNVPMANITAKADPVMYAETRKQKIQLAAPADYVIWTDKTDSIQSFNQDRVVFAGYGVVAPEYNWNDYKDLDVKGKIVMVLVNDPGFNNHDTTMFKGNTMTYYGRWMYKFEEAARQGAKGCLVIHENKAAGYPFDVLRANFNVSRLQPDYRNTPQELCNIIGWITDTAAKKIINASGINADSVFASSDKRSFRGYSLPLSMTTNMKVSTNYNTSKNVLAKITGSKYPDETIVYTAHWDHLGISKPVNGDSIYNGAIDNASGVAGLFEIARAFLKSGKPERTVVFIALTGEEQGLIGSAYYASHPVYPLETTVADINMDCLNYYGKPKDVMLVGKGMSDLEDMLVTLSKKQGRYIGAEDHPEAGFYYRSDHFNFVKRGVPSVHFDDGIDLNNMSKDSVKKIKEEYNTKRYHHPADEYDPNWITDGAIEDLQLYYMLGDELANSHTWPQWKEGAEFRNVRLKSEELRK